MRTMIRVAFTCKLRTLVVLAVFYDEDNFFYDNAKTGDIFMFNGIEGGWRVINPPGRFRLLGVDTGQNHLYCSC